MSDSRRQRPSRGQRYPWYDSVWLETFEQAKDIVRRVRPQALAEFVQAFRVFETPLDFRVREFDTVFDDEVMTRIRALVHSIKPVELEMHEVQTFRRLVVHDQPLFTELQQTLIPRVSEAAGEPLEASYNFLSLYSAMGVCPVHMDSPEAKWTLDLCIDQSHPWPIHFSQVHPWSHLADKAWMGPAWDQEIRQDPLNHFETHILRPGSAILFSGSSQWHYRDAMPAGGSRPFCDLLFFHFIPKGTAELIKPGNWARLFDVAELTDLSPRF
jgi:hypothetical protein